MTNNLTISRRVRFGTSYNQKEKFVDYPLGNFKVIACNSTQHIYISQNFSQQIPVESQFTMTITLVINTYMHFHCVFIMPFQSTAPKFSGKVKNKGTTAACL